MYEARRRLAVAGSCRKKRAGARLQHRRGVAGQRVEELLLLELSDQGLAGGDQRLELPGLAPQVAHLPEAVEDAGGLVGQARPGARGRPAPKAPGRSRSRAMTPSTSAVGEQQRRGHLAARRPGAWAGCAGPPAESAHEEGLARAMRPSRGRPGRGRTSAPRPREARGSPRSRACRSRGSGTRRARCRTPDARAMSARISRGGGAGVVGPRRKGGDGVERRQFRFVGHAPQVVQARRARARDYRRNPRPAGGRHCASAAGTWSRRDDLGQGASAAPRSRSVSSTGSWFALSM